MPTYTSDQFVGQVLHAKRRVPKLRWPNQDSPVLGYVEPGMPVGRIASWITRKAGDPFWYWEFDDPDRGEFATFYVPHDRSLLNLPQLREDYEDDQEAKRLAKLEWWERGLENAANVVQTSAAAAGSSLFAGAMVLGGIYIVGRLITQK